MYSLLKSPQVSLPPGSVGRLMQTIQRRSAARNERRSCLFEQQNRSHSDLPGHRWFQ